VIAYQRHENAAARGIGAESRIWLLDLTTDPLTTFPLFQQAEILGQDPQWTHDGQRLAFYDSFTQSILIYDFAVTDANQQLQAIPYSNGQVGTLSPDGSRLIYPKLVTGDSAGLRAEFQIASLELGTAHNLTDANTPTQDRAAAWHPDGQRVAITRVYPDERFTRGDQIYMVDSFTSTVQPLIYDPQYQHGAISWSPDGSQLLLHRFPMTNRAEALPEVWVYTLTTQALVRVVSDGFYPRWIP
jgi:dipeptidyl aminopeptidase/acylaminoacyl peptidase